MHFLQLYRFGQVTSVRPLPEKFCAFINFKTKEAAGRAMHQLQVSRVTILSFGETLIYSKKFSFYVQLTASFVYFMNITCFFMIGKSISLLTYQSKNIDKQGDHDDAREITAV